jgi:hypothetical protein
MSNFKMSGLPSPRTPPRSTWLSKKTLSDWYGYPINDLEDFLHLEKAFCFSAPSLTLVMYKTVNIRGSLKRVVCPKRIGVFYY